MDQDEKERKKGLYFEEKRPRKHWNIYEKLREETEL